MHRSLEPTWSRILKINGFFAGSFLACWGAHLLWARRSVEWWGLGMLAILLLVAGLAYALRGIIDVVRLVLHQRQLAKFARLGGDPKADDMATERDLRDRGMLR